MSGFINRIFDDRNRLWSIPLAAASAALGFHFISGASQTALQALVQTSLSAGAAFVITAGWALAQDLRRGLPKLPSRAEQYAELKVHGGLINIVREELRGLETGLQEYLAAKKAEGLKIRDQLMDVENDITSIKASDPTSALKGQLSIIADKFGELAGVRAMVSKISSKLENVENLARQAEQAHKRLAQKGWSASSDDGTSAEDWFASIEQRLEAVRKEISSSQNVDVMAEVRETLEEKVAEGVKEMLTTMDEDKLADLVMSGQSDRFKSMDRRMSKMAKTIDGLQKTIENLRWSGAEDTGIASIYKGVQGIDANDPNRQLKSGALAKLFQANISLRKAA